MKLKKVITSELPAQSNDTWESSIIDEGETWTVRYFGACYIKSQDELGSVYILRFGSEIIRIIALCGGTQELNIDETFTGDGVKTFSIQRINDSLTIKRLPCWLVGYKT